MAPPPVDAAKKPVDPKPVDPLPAAEGPKPAPKKDDAVVAEGGKKVEAKIETPSPDAATGNYYSSTWNRFDRFQLDFDVGGAWKNFGNGDGLDHSGWTIGLDGRVKFPFGKQNRWYGSLGLKYDHQKLSMDLDPGSSDVAINSFGLSGGVAFRAVPNWLTLGVDLFAGGSWMNSDCGKNEFGFCDGESGTLFNTNAQLYPMDASGFKLGGAFVVKSLWEILHLKVGIDKTFAGQEIETVTQSPFSQPVTPFGVTLTGGVDLMAIGQKIWGRNDTVAGKTTINPPKDDPKPAQPADKKPAAPDKKPAPAKAEKTVAELATQLAGYKTSIIGARDRVKAIYDKDLRDTSKTPANVLGGQDKKNARMLQLAQEAQQKAAFAEAEYAAAQQVYGQMAKKVADMPAGSDKIEAEKKLVDAKKDLVGARGDNKLSMYEGVADPKNGAQAYAKKATDYYNNYAKKTQGVDKIEYSADKVDKPEGYTYKATKRDPVKKDPVKKDPVKKDPVKKDPSAKPPKTDL